MMESMTRSLLYLNPIFKQKAPCNTGQNAIMVEKRAKTFNIVCFIESTILIMGRLLAVESYFVKRDFLSISLFIR